MTSLVRVGIPIAFALFAMLFAYNVRDMDFRATAFPYFAIMFILLLSATVTIKELYMLVRQRQSAEDELCPPWEEFKKTYARPVATMVLLAIYVYSIPRFGFVPVTAVFLIAMCVVIGVPWRKLPMSAVMMLCVTAAAYVFFSIVLRIQLP